MGRRSHSGALEGERGVSLRTRRAKALLRRPSSSAARDVSLTLRVSARVILECAQAAAAVMGGDSHSSTRPSSVADKARPAVPAIELEGRIAKRPLDGVGLQEAREPQLPSLARAVVVEDRHPVLLDRTRA